MSSEFTSQAPNPLAPDCFFLADQRRERSKHTANRFHPNLDPQKHVCLTSWHQQKLEIWWNLRQFTSFQTLLEPYFKAFHFSTTCFGLDFGLLQSWEKQILHTGSLGSLSMSLATMGLLPVSSPVSIVEKYQRVKSKVGPLSDSRAARRATWCPHVNESKST